MIQNIDFNVFIQMSCGMYFMCSWLGCINADFILLNTVYRVIFTSLYFYLMTLLNFNTQSQTLTIYKLKYYFRISPFEIFPIKCVGECENKIGMKITVYSIHLTYISPQCTLQSSSYS